MEGILKNPELKSVVIKMVLLQLLLAILLFFVVNTGLVSLNNKIIDENAALVGHILSEYPQMEDNIAGYITKGADKEEIDNGRQVLKDFGYEKNMPLSHQTMYKDSFINIPIKIVLLALIYLIPIVLLLFFEYSRIFKKVRTIAFSADKVVEGDFSIIRKENLEGEFGKLSHSFDVMAERLKLNLEKLKEDKVLLKNIISDISHQLKTPLASLVILNDNLLQDKDMGEEIRMEFLNRSKAQLDRIEWLVENLLKMARLEADAIDFRYEKIQLSAPVQASVNYLRDLWKEKNQEIKINSEDNMFLYGDEEWLEEALANIIKNCVEHTGIGGKIDIELKETPLFNRIVIRDTGEGIDPKDLPHVFERFYSGNNSAKAKSVGIGLSLSRLIIEKQGGSISVNSVKGEGTEFVITFLKGII
ncbi:HAMP domain-containing sensor histidine kinase [Clostridium cellulovorans]|uniref:histidine kinase n=1 Tax=Clostridium cellulovorans (strain ATCC 35296 / DSM 3052 / OCM 3 / 743B) TaxID=573061 RepID=D9SUL9_CLOC7|nr:HAMP domain-containing sensor histidine kinase [Clostridium cellulovorans]ADL50924.1 integral membrane sensor signal transduction histidine kinase [Clostridium cellulovorans 743B]